MSSTFSDLGVRADVVAALAERGISQPFPIQTLAIPPALAGKDVCGRAPTGSGKTLAFGIPLAQRVTRARASKPRALVLAPTRELAAQIEKELRELLAPYGRTVAAFYGGVGFGAQLKALRRGVDVAVACPGRLTDLVNQRSMSLEEVATVVIDEADRMADMGFLPAVRRILDQVRSDRQTLLFSATLDGDVDVLIRHYQRQPERCEIASTESDDDRTTHQFVATRREERVPVAAQLVATHGTTVVFCRTKHGADRVAAQLQRAGVSAAAIHGGRSQAQRERALASFAGGKVAALVATDVAARGIHVDDVRCVVHFDVAGSHKDYLHRSGRTGRAGADGVVVSLVTEADVAAVRQMQKELDLPLFKGPAADAATSAPQPAGAGTSPRPNRARSGAGAKGQPPRGRAGGRARRAQQDRAGANGSAGTAGASAGRRRRPAGRRGSPAPS